MAAVYKRCVFFFFVVVCYLFLFFVSVTPPTQITPGRGYIIRTAVAKRHTFHSPSLVVPEAFDGLIYGRRPRRRPIVGWSVGRVQNSSASETAPRIKNEKKKKIESIRWGSRQQCIRETIVVGGGRNDGEGTRRGVRIYLLVNRIRGRDFRIGFVTELSFAVLPRCGILRSRAAITSTSRVIAVIIIVTVIASGRTRFRGSLDNWFTPSAL